MPFLPLRQHPLRQTLNDELHARPPMALAEAEWVSCLTMLHEGTSIEAEEQHLQALCGLLGTGASPQIQGNHCVLVAGRLRLKWERHNEFSGYSFFLRREAEDGADTTALDALPDGWLQGIPGVVIMACHVEWRPAGEDPLAAVHQAVAARSDTTVATTIGEGAAWVVSDFHLADGWSRFLVLDEGMPRRQAGRTVQRLLEIETYRMMALLAFPLAKEVAGLLSRCEGELAALTEAMGWAQTPEDERALLAELTRLATAVEHSLARSAFRFGAAEAYFKLVEQRIRDLREIRLTGYPPIQEFMERRLAPAMHTCLAVARRQEALSERVARQSALMRTRVEMELQRQNQELLAQMNKRARLQLRLQETVEGLSVVVLTYYGSSLVHHLAEAWHEAVHSGPSPAVVTAWAIPLIAALVAWGTGRLRKKLAAEEGGH